MDTHQHPLKRPTVGDRLLQEDQRLRRHRVVADGPDLTVHGTPKNVEPPVAAVFGLRSTTAARPIGSQLQRSQTALGWTHVHHVLGGVHDQEEAEDRPWLFEHAHAHARRTPQETRGGFERL